MYGAVFPQVDEELEDRLDFIGRIVIKAGIPVETEIAAAHGGKIQDNVVHAARVGQRQGNGIEIVLGVCQFLADFAHFFERGRNLVGCRGVAPQERLVVDGEGRESIELAVVHRIAFNDGRTQVFREIIHRDGHRLIAAFRQFGDRLGGKDIAGDIGALIPGNSQIQRFSDGGCIIVRVVNMDSGLRFKRAENILVIGFHQRHELVPPGQGLGKTAGAGQKHGQRKYCS